MIIEKSCRSDHVSFEDIKPGDVFSFDGELFMKLETVHLLANDVFDLEHANAVKLNGGELYGFEGYDVVLDKSKKVKLIVEE